MVIITTHLLKSGENMKLRNKKTGETMIVVPHMFDNYTSLAELNEEWEDYEEPKEVWHINSLGEVEELNIDEKFTDSAKCFISDSHLEIGNYFGSKEEAEKAVEKLKAWKRLKDNGFRFLDYTALGLGEIKFEHNVMDEIEDVEQLEKDLDLLFGGEE